MDLSMKLLGIHLFKVFTDYWLNGKRKLLIGKQNKLRNKNIIKENILPVFELFLFIMV